MRIKESAENYLEAILVLKQEKGQIRSIDVAHHFGYSKPSISRAMALLRESGDITVDKEGFIELTPPGRQVAERINERHNVISTWLISIGVSEKVALEDACRIEHDLSDETFGCIKTYIAERGK